MATEIVNEAMKKNKLADDIGMPRPYPNLPSEWPKPKPKDDKCGRGK